ncbi:MAG TPA: tRNA lysidine(34) synthetase TilS [Jiangellaceae bacterium]|nr:tRNA lysidine(34) synthetase TilS [Jiangellaceae bacterium]
MAGAAQLAVRRAVRSSLADLDAGRPVLVACSGGADSLALAAALHHVAQRAGRRAGSVTVDHGLQDGSADQARAVAGELVRLGLDPVEIVHVRVRADRRGPEGDARTARYAALDAAAARHDAAGVLLGHTRDDQAETVLLGLARGSGARSLAGMPAESGRYRRPLLGLSRATVRAALPADVKPWEDPFNADPAYARARVRHRVLPTLEAELGPGVADALSRTADLLRADADALDGWAARALHDSRIVGDQVQDGDPASGHDWEQQSLDIHALYELPEAVRSRVVRRAAIDAGSPPTDLTAAHVRAVDALVTRWRGQRGIDLPGKVRATREGSVLRIGHLR